MKTGIGDDSMDAPLIYKYFLQTRLQEIINMKINHRNNALGKKVIQQIFGYIKDNK